MAGMNLSLGNLPLIRTVSSLISCDAPGPTTSRHRRANVDPPRPPALSLSAASCESALCRGVLPLTMRRLMIARHQGASFGAVGFCAGPCTHGGEDRRKRTPSNVWPCGWPSAGHRNRTGIGSQRPARAPFSNSKSLARLSNDGPQSASYMA